MQLYSTNDISRSQTVSFQEAVFQSLPADNGLYMPTELPLLDDAFFNEIEKFTFPEIAFQVATMLLDDEIPALKLRDLIEDAIDFPAPVVALDKEVYVLELFHGPTLAFKDFGARFMARTMSWFLQQSPGEQERTILVATSGDTGSAVAQGFLNVPGINVVLLYPSGKVSEIQEKQLTTVGNNVSALEVSGTFDDCQRMVKEAFLDQELRKEVALSSANSINISRLIPQSFYYFNAYAQLKRDLGFNPDWPLVFSVPSGNFGNLCGGLIAQQMGLPIDHIVASTNVNDVVPEYLETGKFTPRPSVQTISNAMDVGNPSNFARLQAFYGYVGSDDELLDSIQEDISGNRFSDDTTEQAIQEVYENYYGYIMCPHTAVGYLGLKDYLEKQSGRANGVVLATAHPAKFKDTVEEAIGESIPLPETLQAVLNQPKQATSISSDYEALKTYLMDR